MYHQSKLADDSNNPRNFLRLNKKAVIQGQVTAKDNYEFRKHHDSRIPFGVSALQNNRRHVSLPQEGFTYGRRNRPQTPIDGIIGNNYGEEAFQHIQTRYAQMKMSKIHSSPQQPDIKFTYAQMKANEFVKTKNSFDLFGQSRP